MQDFLDRRTTSQDLTELAKKYSIPLSGVLRYTQIPFGDVSHVTYVDSYGMPPPRRLPHLNGRVVWRNMQFQPVRNKSCGIFALAQAAQMALNGGRIDLSAYHQTSTLDSQDDTAAYQITRMKSDLERLKRGGGLPPGHKLYIANLDAYGPGLHWVAVYTFTAAARPR